MKAYRLSLLIRKVLSQKVKKSIAELLRSTVKEFSYSFTRSVETWFCIKIGLDNTSSECHPIRMTRTYKLDCKTYFSQLKFYEIAGMQSFGFRILKLKVNILSMQENMHSFQNASNDQILVVFIINRFVWRILIRNSKFLATMNCT